MDCEEVKKAIATLKLQSKDVDVEAKELMCVNGDHCFFWDRNQFLVLCVNLSQHLRPDESRIQTLRPTNCPMFDVDRILISPQGKWVCLQGRKGVSCLELPRKSGKSGRFLNGKKEITCKTVTLCEDLLTRNQRLTAQNVQFHPGNVEEEVIVVLTSDNRLHFFNLDLDSKPILVI